MLLSCRVHAGIRHLPDTGFEVRKILSLYSILLYTTMLKKLDIYWYLIATISVLSQQSMKGWRQSKNYTPLL